ncbi:Putative two-component response regulator [hydrothermal vent metagenome]|uniref:Putative two-component response regulator n=1 Tax=hydrothermal vent metagenome TaxID=652676 RepID=A0A1W1CE17_9ZZZZ
MNEKILIVEDNKTVANLIAKKLEDALNIEIDIAYSLREAKLFLHQRKYFITLVDINLPDAPNGEIVDYVIEKKNRVIILTQNRDKELRKNMFKKNIIDYINKNGINDVEYVVQTIHRLHKNQNHKVLVVDDSLLFRKQMQNMLTNLCFDVITVAHGEEAIGILNVQQDISLVITDYNMPVMDGLELTLKIRESYTKNELCILALSGDKDDETSALFLKNGANDYIKKPFSKEEFSCRVNNSIEALENIQKITHYADRDYLTGLYNRRYFYKNVETYLDMSKESGEETTIAMINIDHFKQINDTYGHNVGNKVIVSVADILRSGTDANDIVAHFGEEEFCILLKNISNNISPEDILQRLRKSVENFTIEIDEQRVIKSTISIGAIIHDLDETLEESINEADMILYQAKNAGENSLIFRGN